jgi:hypothetical protein
VANRNAQDGRTTKAERKEQARRERLEIERRMSRSKRNRWIAIGVTVVVVAAVVVFVVTRPRSATAEAAPADLLATAASQATAAGCSEVRDAGPYQPEDQDRSHIGADGGPAEMPPLSSYPSVPPASGPHNAQPLGAGVYSTAPPIDQLIHSLEHGASVVWYSPDTSSAQLTKIQDFYRGSEGARVIVAPYDYPDEGEAGQLPAGTEMALVSWHHVQTCARANLAAAFGFTARYAAPPFSDQEYLGDAPEPGAAL